MKKTILIPLIASVLLIGCQKHPLYRYRYVTKKIETNQIEINNDLLYKNLLEYKEDVENSIKNPNEIKANIMVIWIEESDYPDYELMFSLNHQTSPIPDIKSIKNKKIENLLGVAYIDDKMCYIFSLVPGFDSDNIYFSYGQKIKIKAKFNSDDILNFSGGGRDSYLYFSKDKIHRLDGHFWNRPPKKDKE